MVRADVIVSSRADAVAFTPRAGRRARRASAPARRRRSRRARRESRARGGCATSRRDARVPRDDAARGRAPPSKRDLFVSVATTSHRRSLETLTFVSRARVRLFLSRHFSLKKKTADIISAVEFDTSGEHLATGDRGGRVVLFERLRPTKFALEETRADLDREEDRSASSAALDASAGTAKHTTREPAEYRYLTEFQSHEPEFDYLKSLEIEEKINTLRWCHHSANTSRFLISTNDKTIKLWKVFQKQIQCVSDFNLDDPARANRRTGAGRSPRPRRRR